MVKTYSNPEGREIVAETFIDAPRERVYRVSTQPEKIRHWRGCERMTMPVCENDVRVGGTYRFVGREPNGAEHAFRGEYREVVENERIVHTETYEPFPDAEALVTVTFIDRDGGTELTSRIVFSTDEAYRGATSSGMESGMAESIGRLAELAMSRELTISRLIDAPRERVFGAWSDPASLTHWWAPRPYVTTQAEIDVRSGGRFFTVMRSPEGAEYPGDGVFLEVVPNERIVFTDAYRAGWIPNLNPFITAIITLEDEAGRTRYTARVLHWSVADCERHEAMGFEAGWGKCLDQLAELVARTPQPA